MPSEEIVVQLSLSELYPFPNHPFKVRDDEAMHGMMESVSQYGVLTPAIVRPREAGGYEIVAGHRRKHASEAAGLETIPAIIRDMDDDAAIILMVDSNIQRENILPSEKAQAYRMKLDAIKRKGARTDLTSPQAAARFRADDEVAKELGISGDTVRRYIRLTELSPQLQQMVDEKEIALTPAVELSYLKPEEQALVTEAIDSGQAVPTLTQAQQLKRSSQEGSLDRTAVLSILVRMKEDENHFASGMRPAAGTTTGTTVDVLGLELPAYNAVYNGTGHVYPTDQLTGLKGVKNIHVTYIGTLPNGKPYELPSPPVDAGSYTARLWLTATDGWILTAGR